VHAIGGIVGGILTGFFSTDKVTGNPSLNGVFYGSVSQGGHQLAAQLAGIAFSVGWAGFVSFLLLKAIDSTIGLRVSAEDEDAGLDTSLHNETIVSPEGVKYEQARKRESLRQDDGVEMGGIPPSSTGEAIIDPAVLNKSSQV
jgi:ammonia channel protein AmtB